MVQRLAYAIETLSDWSGRVVGWLVLAMACVIFYDVVMRYLFNSGSVALQELEWHLFALVLLFGVSYAMRHDAHVRVDIFYHSRFISARQRACIDLLGGALFMLPFCLLVIYCSLPFVENSFFSNEGSPDPGGLPARWLLKGAIPLGFTLLLLQGIATMIRAAQTVLTKDHTVTRRGE
ncbi:MAG: TRAP transporter small permease subunit [Gammaproteobacteria bacterium]|nr:TRAP transporter small permease subunit [Gammaproteobacteria bacterium]